MLASIETLLDRRSPPMTQVMEAEPVWLQVALHTVPGKLLVQDVGHSPSNRSLAGGAEVHTA